MSNPAKRQCHDVWLKDKMDQQHLLFDNNFWNMVVLFTLFFVVLYYVKHNFVAGLFNKN